MSQTSAAMIGQEGEGQPRKGTSDTSTAGRARTRDAAGFTRPEAQRRNKIARGLQRHYGLERTAAMAEAVALVLCERFLADAVHFSKAERTKQMSRILQAQRQQLDTLRKAFPPAKKRGADAAFRDAR